MSAEAKSTTRRTLPAPSAPIDVEALIAERDQLRQERDDLLKRLAAREAAAREAVFLMDEIGRLRAELARHRSLAVSDNDSDLQDLRLPTENVPLPPPSALPRGFAAPLFAPADVPGGGPRKSAPQENGGLDFGAVSRLSPGELDQLPYGLICLDANGRVVHYNDAESRLARLPKERVIGKNFFADVAPCTRVREFEGEFYELVRDASKIRVRTFDFVFRFRHSEQHVTIVLTPARQRGLYNMALLRRSVREEG